MAICLTLLTLINILKKTIKKFYNNKKELSDIEHKIGEEWQGRVITNDTNLSIMTWEKVDE